MSRSALVKGHTRANRPSGILSQKLLEVSPVGMQGHVLTYQCVPVSGENLPSDGVGILGLAPQACRQKADQVIRVAGQQCWFQVHFLALQLEEGANNCLPVPVMGLQEVAVASQPASLLHGGKLMQGLPATCDEGSDVTFGALPVLEGGDAEPLIDAVCSFERFYRADSSCSPRPWRWGGSRPFHRPVPGHTAHHGRVEMTTGPGQGAAFRIVLPPVTDARPTRTRPAAQHVDAQQTDRGGEILPARSWRQVKLCVASAVSSLMFGPCPYWASASAPTASLEGSSTEFATGPPPGHCTPSDASDQAR